MRAYPYEFLKLTTLPQHLYTWLSQRRSLYVALTAGAHPYHQTDVVNTPGFPGLNTPSPPSPTRAHRTPTHAASADRSHNDPNPPIAPPGGPVLDARPLGTCSVGHKSRRRSPTSARDASRQSRVGCRVVSVRHRHAIRLRRAGDAYRVDGSLHVDRRAERCSATACAAHVCRRSWRARQQLWVS